jgi:dolichyl-phosphate beta-glucosyltransferase
VTPHPRAQAPAAPDAPAPDVSIIIPAYNEERRLPGRLAHVLGYLRQHYPAFELLVVDDGSTDGTAAAVARALEAEPRARLLRHQPNRGKGYAIRAGMLASRGARVVFVDADLSTPIEELPRALQLLDEAEVVIGSRDLPLSDVRVKQPLYRRLASEIFKWLRYLMVGLWHLRDTQCGFKAYRGPEARRLFAQARIDRFMFDVEILYLAERAGLRIVEMPVRWDDAPGSTVRFWPGLRDTARDLWRIRWLHRERPSL